MNPKLQAFIQGLLEGTRSGTFRWTLTPEKGVYRLMLDKGLVRISRFGRLTVSDNCVGCTVLNAAGSVLHDVQVPHSEGGFLVTLYDLVNGTFQEDAMDELLTEVRSKLSAARS
jgi:hypothetical protein